MNLFKMTLLTSSLALLAACGGSDKIDGSTEAKFSASMTSISQNIEIAKKDELDRSLSVVRASYGSDRAGMAKALDGKDADAVIADGTSVSEDCTNSTLLRKARRQSISAVIAAVVPSSL